MGNHDGRTATRKTKTKPKTQQMSENILPRTVKNVAGRLHEIGIRDPSLDNHFIMARLKHFFSGGLLVVRSSPVKTGPKRILVSTDKHFPVLHVQPRDPIQD